MLPVQRCHYIRHVWWSGATLRYACLYKLQLYQTCMLGSWIHLRMFVKCYSIKQGIWSVTNPSDMPTGRMPLPQGCKICWVPSWMPSWIYQILNDVLIAPLGCYKDNVCSSKISKIKFCMKIPGAYQSSGRFSYIFCYKLASWRPSCPHSFPTFYLVTS